MRNAQRLEGLLRQWSKACYLSTRGMPEKHCSRYEFFSISSASMQGPERITVEETKKINQLGESRIGLPPLRHPVRYDTGSKARLNLKHTLTIS